MVANPFVILISTIITLIWWAIMVWFVLGLLIQFNVVNRWNPFVNKVYTTLENIIDPMLKPIRRYVPLMGGMDFSPLILILGLQFIQNALVYPW